MQSPAKTHLNAMLGSYPKTRALKSGAITVEGVDLEFAPIDDAIKGFKGIVKEQKFDLGELALSTFLQARSVNKPYVLIPFVMNGKFHHGSLLRRADNPFTAGDLHGRTVAMRSYSQTTPTWVRGFLMDDFGVEVDKVKWLARDPGHVAECADPPWVKKLTGDKDLFQSLLDGDVDAILFGAKREDDPRVVTVLADPDASALDWAERNNAVPINHMVVIREQLAKDRPDIVRAVYAALLQSRSAAEGPQKPGTRDPQPYGFAAVRPALQIAIRNAVAQGLIPKAPEIDELYGPVRDALASFS
jgi:4,5-dihydroxyphthalate decarboxylase